VKVCAVLSAILVYQERGRLERTALFASNFALNGRKMQQKLLKCQKWVLEMRQWELRKFLRSNVV
jgi:hypothetical protein